MDKLLNAPNHMIIQKDCNKITSGDNDTKCTIMSKDTILLELVIAEHSSIYIKECKTVKECIVNQGNIGDVLNSRFSAFSRLGLRDYLDDIGLKSKIDLLYLTHGVSLSDCLWVRFDGEDLSWKDVNPYTQHHKFDIKWLIEKDNKLLDMVLPNYASSGKFPKCWFTDNNTHKLIKCGHTGAYNCGLEPLSEVLFNQIADAIKFTNYVKYNPYFVDYSNSGFDYITPGLVNDTIGRTDKRLSSICDCMCSDNKALISAKDLGLKSYSDCVSFARKNVLNHIHLGYILLCDCIGYNEDRHLGNISFEYNPDTMEITSVAPMYDNNLSLLCYWEDRIDLMDYVSMLRVKDGQTFDSLAKYVFNEYPSLFNVLKSVDINLSSTLVISNRLDILNYVVFKNVNNLLNL